MPAAHAELVVWAGCAVLVALGGACNSDIFHDTDWPASCVHDCGGGPPATAASSGSGGGTGGSVSSASGTGADGGAGAASVSSSTSASVVASSGAGGKIDPIGCSDGEREGFASEAAFPSIAACSGGWSIPGVLGPPAPACVHSAGDDSLNVGGLGCSASDLCSVGWHVCTGAADVAASGAPDCGALAPTIDGFFAVAQSGAGLGQCGAGANDVFGCGTVGVVPDPITCAPIDRFSNDLCIALPAPWSCGADNLNEASQVTKGGPDVGGVLCCRD